VSKMQITKQLVSQSVINQRSYGKGNPKKYITVHQTGNTDKGANAQMHANLQSRLNSREASWHYQVDDKVVIQSFEDDVKCWHAGDGNGPGNNESIAIEMCVNSDGDYKKTLQNGAKLVKHLMDKHNIPIQNVKQHYDWSRKNCPAQIRAGKDGITWDDFLEMVESEDKPQTNNNVHIVKSGDTLSQIAVDNSTTVNELVKLNNIDNPDLIVVGQKIKLPGESTSTEFKVGDKVKIKSNAKTYSWTSGVKIPPRVKGRTYTIYQVSENDVLLKEIYSWIKKSDVQ